MELISDGLKLLSDVVFPFLAHCHASTDVPQPVFGPRNALLFSMVFERLQFWPSIKPLKAFYTKSPIELFFTLVRNSNSFFFL